MTDIAISGPLRRRGGRPASASAAGRSLQHIEPAVRNGFYALPAPIRSAIAAETLRKVKNPEAN
jgi:hypothetical protein